MLNRKDMKRWKKGECVFELDLVAHSSDTHFLPVSKDRFYMLQLKKKKLTKPSTKDTAIYYITMKI